MTEALRIVADEQVLTPLAEAASGVALEPLAARLIDMRAWLADDLSVLERGIVGLEGLARDDEPAKRAARHLLEQPGKRVRPLCVLLAARLGGRGCDADVRRLAIAAELIHAATLLHDDVLDEGTERRGAAAARVLYGNSASILGGDHLLIEALRGIQATGQAELLTSMLDTITEIVTAEALQLTCRGRFVPDREAYHRVIHGKTAVLFKWAFDAGACAAGLAHDQRRALCAAGLAIGRGFQLVDDLLDLDGDPEQTGKDLFNDLAEGKLTWPLILAAEARPQLTPMIEACMGAQDGASAAAEVVAEVRATGALEATRARAAGEIASAREALSELPEGRARQALMWVTESVLHRSK
jgi:octaprenyl-diphosphate synthase